MTAALVFIPTALRTSEVARVWGVSTQTVRRWATSGLRANGRVFKLPSLAVGAHGFRFRPADVEQFGRLMTAIRDQRHPSLWPVSGLEASATAPGLTPAEIQRQQDAADAALST